MRLALPLLLVSLVAACSIETRYDGLTFSCERTGECPKGQDCVDGTCRAPAADDEPADDIAPGSPDAGPPGADAAANRRIELDVTGADLTSDTYLLLETPDVNYGDDATVHSDAEPVKVGLLRFDLGNVPAGAEVASATLSLYFPDPIEDGSFAVYSVAEPWTENGATYNEREPGVAWAAPGAASDTGDAIATTAPLEIGPVQVELPAQVVQGWLDDDSLNHGVRWVAESELGRGGQFSSSENPESDYRPVLSLGLLVAE